MTEVLVTVSALVGIAAGLCTVLGYLEGRPCGGDRDGGGHRGRTLPPRRRTLPEDPGEGSGPSAEGGGEEGSS